MSPDRAPVILLDMSKQASCPAFVVACILVAGCNDRPPQTETFVLNGSPPEAVHSLVLRIAKDVGFKVSQKTFETPAGSSRNYEAYGEGLSIFVIQAMREECPGPNGNYPRAQVDPERYDVLVAKTGLWAHHTPSAIFAAFAQHARSANMGLEAKTVVQQRMTEHCGKGR